jgi:hypothetical protein
MERDIWDLASPRRLGDWRRAVMLSTSPARAMSAPPDRHPERRSLRFRRRIP